MTYHLISHASCLCAKAVETSITVSWAVGLVAGVGLIFAFRLLSVMHDSQ